MKISHLFVALFLLLSLTSLAAELDKKTVKVTASAWEQKAHGGFADFPPEATLDGKLDGKSSWRVQGDGAWIQYELPAATRLKELKIAFLSGEKRVYTIDILISKTGKDDDWTTVSAKTPSSGKTADFESFKIDAETRFVRIVGHGNNSKEFPNWTNLTEVAFVSE